ncbi:hypothetical protein HDU96_000407 [Phlyctochytrium bullatum]|nr:hypothetical protein HDU96_000407 [Phlyctochytrium bullatum]
MPSIAIPTLNILLLLAPLAYAQLQLGQKFSGKMTYYGQGGGDPPPIKTQGGIGACGFDSPPDERYFAALYQPLFNAHLVRWPSNVCGQCVSVGCVDGDDRCGGRTVIVPIVDSCPGCEATGVDLSHQAFAELVGSGEEATRIGKMAVTWTVVDCPKQWGPGFSSFGPEYAPASPPASPPATPPAPQPVTPVAPVAPIPEPAAPAPILDPQPAPVPIQPAQVSEPEPELSLPEDPDAPVFELEPEPTSSSAVAAIAPTTEPLALPLVIVPSTPVSQPPTLLLPTTTAPSTTTAAARPTPSSTSSASSSAGVAPTTKPVYDEDTDLVDDDDDDAQPAITGVATVPGYATSDAAAAAGGVSSRPAADTTANFVFSGAGRGAGGWGVAAGVAAGLAAAVLGI